MSEVWENIPLFVCVCCCIPVSIPGVRRKKKLEFRNGREGGKGEGERERDCRRVGGKVRIEGVTE